MLHRNRVLLIRALRQIVGVLLFLSGTAAIAAALNPVPLVYQPLLPDAAKPGGAAFTLTIDGAGFVVGAVVRWNGSPRTTTFVSRTQLKASILAADIAKAGTASITVANPAPGGGTSNSVSFPITLASTFISFYGSDYTVGTGPWDTAVGDFNGDGKLDLAVTNNTDSTVSILTGSGNGSFKALGTTSTGLNPQDITTADLNGDGKLDLAIANDGAGTVSILLGRGDGTFVRQDYITGESPQTVAVADFNGDGKLDLAVANYGPAFQDSTVSIFLGNGNGTFQAQVAYPAGVNPVGVLVGDFNRDGKLDLAVLNNNAPFGISILLGNGDGTFGNPVLYPSGNNSRIGMVADFNADGKLDLAIANYSDSDVSILFGNGDGSFQAPVNYSVGGNPAALRGADLNGDGKLDLVTANQTTNSMSVLLGNGDGTFQTHIDYPGGPGGVAIGDFNADGRLDVALIGITASTVSVKLQGPTDSVSKTSLTFAGEVVGTSSATQTVTLTNTSNLFELSISSIAVTGTNAGDFSQTDTCGSSVAPGAGCTISVVFKPTNVGPRTAAITINDNISTPQSIALSGTGVVAGPNVTFSTTGLTYATQAIGTSSSVQSVTLTNLGSVALSISGISMKGADPGDYLQTNTCGSSVASTASCIISVTFKPTGINTRTASLSIADNAPGSPQSISLSGTGTEVQLNPARLSFMCRTSTHTCPPPPQSSTLTNVGATPLTISSITITGAFSETNNCPSVLRPSGSCTITIHPTAKIVGTFRGSVSVSDNGGGSPQLISLLSWVKAALAAPALSALAATPTATVPKPTGPSLVGTRIVESVDSVRADPFTGNGTSRKLLLRFWYPASINDGCEPAPYTSPATWTYFSELVGLRLPEVKTNSCLDAPVSEGLHPVVVFSHGYTGTFTDYTFLFEDLASRGYVVASIDHTHEATAVEFPDGRFSKSQVGSHLDNSWRIDYDTVSFALSARLDDLTFVMNELERLNSAGDNPFVGKLDLTRVALAGHSLGGLTAWLGLQREPRFKVAILLDPYLADIGSDSMETPVLLMTMGHEKPSQDECQLWSDLHGPRSWVNLRGAEHVTPSDAVWLAKGAIRTGAMGPEKTMDALRSYIAAFLDSNFRGEAPDALLEGSSPEFPDISVTTQEQPMCRQP